LSWSQQAAAPVAGIYDVRQFGAKGDGKALDAPAINKAIDAAHAAGGGTVRVPAGTYLCYTIRLKSNVSLYLDAGSTILAAEPPKPPTTSPAYDEPEENPFRPFQGFGQSYSRNSLIAGVNLANISILGPGRIDGAGRLFKDQGFRPHGVANKAIGLRLCRHVTIRDVSITAAGHFAILATGVDNLTVDNVTIDNDRDGMDFDCCRNVRIANCAVNTPNDDAICLKSTYTLGQARATENVTITNCQVSGYLAGTLLDGTLVVPRPDQTPKANSGPMGRIKLGTESVGGFRNITISNCTFDHCHGFALIDVDGGALEDVAISNITMRHIAQSPFFFRLASRSGKRPGDDKAPSVGSIRRVNISNVLVYDDESSVCSIISGIPGHDIQDISLNNIRIVCRGGGTNEQAALEPQERERNYPEPNMFGDMPAYGFFIRHAAGIDMNNVAISYLKEDARPPLVLSDVKGITFDRLSAEHAPGVAVMKLNKIADLDIHQCPGVAPERLNAVDEGTIAGDSR
jgi:polygalacturonase